jgi:4a-hydroxytetrahydrobiopterin dehydratase
MNLAQRDPIPGKELSGTLPTDELGSLSSELGDAWQVVENHHLERGFEFDDFGAAMDFADDVGDLAEEMDHHPDICFGWGYCKITIWTHKVDGLSINDFIFAARVNSMLD